jgi:tRNA-dihydrouridine synthase B
MLPEYDKISAMRNPKATIPTFMVGNIPVYGDLILSPMDGISDLPFRSLARNLGSAMSYTEFINAIDFLRGDPRLAPCLKYDEVERPLVYQVYDSSPDRIVRAALKLRELQPDIIDVNMGCPAKTVSARGAGVGLMRNPIMIGQIFSRLVKALDIPVTGKIRLGWADQRNYLEVARAVEDNGGQLLAVHGRTKEQGYSGQANWDPIAEIKQTLKIPVIGNGDVRTVADIAAIKAHTGCDGVMIGRGAIENPWIFQCKDRHEVSDDQVRETMRFHLNSSLNFYGPDRGLILFRKFATRYLRPYMKTREQRMEIMQCQSPETFLSLAEELIAPGPDFSLLIVRKEGVFNGVS